VKYVPYFGLTGRRVGEFGIGCEGRIGLEGGSGTGSQKGRQNEEKEQEAAQGERHGDLLCLKGVTTRSLRSLEAQRYRESMIF
jgi:hypothetical protein